MNWDIVDGTWKQFKGKLSDDRLEVNAGNRVGLTGTLQEASHKGGCMMNEVIPPRRVVLRGALAIAAGLWVPITISGCNSKKGETSSSAAPASSPSTSPDSAAPAASKKVSQASVQYQSQPKGEQKCGGCQHFIAGSNTCELVDGQISPDGWCKLWAKKA
ncbi:MAG: high-potential iron-sulfur protein [Thiobacillaceae bacterium]